MAANKEHPVNIVIRAIDRATAPMRAINARIESITEPARRINNQFRAMGQASGIGKLSDRFKGVGTAFGNVGSQVSGLGLQMLGIAGIAGGGAFGILSLARSASDLGDKLAKTSARVGLTVNAFAELEFAAGRSGVGPEDFSTSMDFLNKTLGQTKAGMGPLVGLLKNVSPALLEQVTAAKSTEEAFNLITGAIHRVEDPSKRATLAAAAFGRSGLKMVNLAAEGADGIAELRKEFQRIAGDQSKFAKNAEIFNDQFGDLQTALKGLQSTALAELFPAFTALVKTGTEFLIANREAVGAFAKDFAAKLPDRLAAIAAGFHAVMDVVRPFIAVASAIVERLGGLKFIAGLVAALIVGKLLIAIYGLTSAFIALGVAILTTPIGWIMAAIALIAGGAYLLISNWDKVRGFFTTFWTEFGDLILGAVAVMFGPIGWMIAAAGLLISHWEPVKTFFLGIWDVMKNVAGFIGRAMGGAGTLNAGGTGPSLGANEMGGPGGFLSPGAQRTETAVSVSFKNAPRGMRVDTEPGGTAELDLSLGYTMAESL